MKENEIEGYVALLHNFLAPFPKLGILGAFANENLELEDTADCSYFWLKTN